MMKFLPQILASFVLAASVATVDASVAITIGTSPSVDLPTLTGFGTQVSEMAGTDIRIDCTSMGTSFTSSLDANGNGVWFDDNGDEVGSIVYLQTGTTFQNPLRVVFDLFMQPGMCPYPVLTLDLRSSCSSQEGSSSGQIVWDILPGTGGTTSTPGSAQGALDLEGGGCMVPVPVTADIEVGIDGAAPVGDLFLLLVFDLTGCTFPVNDPLELILDTDTTDETSCQTIPPTPVPTLPPVGMDGDPHIKTWSGASFDYMGACDLVLLSAPNSVDNKDLTLLARTTIRYAYSFIETAAIKIGDSVLEVSSFGQHSLDGVDNALAASDGGRLTLDDYPISYKKVDEKKHVFEIVLSESETITLFTFKDLVGIRMSNEASREFFGTDATGIMGSMDGKLLGRDGVTDMSADTDAFGQEWQVRPEVDGNFFQTSRAPQYPEKCIMPSATTKQVRRLGESSLQVEAAETACGRFSGDRFENCIYDVMATGDLEVADAGAF